MPCAFSQIQSSSRTSVRLGAWLWSAQADIFFTESLRILAERLSQSETHLPLRIICYYSPPEEMGVFSTEINIKIDVRVKSFWPLWYRIALHCVLPQFLKTFVIRSFFFEKWLLTHVFGGSRGQKSSCKQVCIGFLTFWPWYQYFMKIIIYPLVFLNFHDLSFSTIPPSL